MRERVHNALGDGFELGTELGRGALSIVYRATDRKLRRRVAIKVLPPDIAFREDVRTRFLREAETAARLNHPNIVPIYSVDERDQVVFFVMALIEGGSLGAHLAREARPTLAVVRRVLREVADALAYAHSRGVIHRDIKPDNILIDAESGRAMVSDFGIAWASETDSRLTMTGTSIGTPAYMSPEQATGEREIDHRSDLYSLGVVGYQMLAGALPFRASNTPSMLMKHLSEQPRPMLEVRPDAPPGLARTVERALAKRPDDRWPSAAAFRDALSDDSWRGEGGADAREPSSPFSPPPPSPPLPVASRQGSPSGPPRASKSHAEPRFIPPALPQAPLPPRLSRPPFHTPPQPPTSLSRREWRQYHREMRRWEKDEQREMREEKKARKRDSRPVGERVVRFRRSLAGYGALVGMLGGINMLTSPEFAWFLFPAFGMGAPLLGQLGTLWAEGIGLRRIFGRDAVRSMSAGGSGGSPAVSPSGASGDPAAAIAPPEILAGPHGAAVRRAAADHAAILSIVEGLPAVDRALLPEIGPTSQALLARVTALAQMLRQLEADVPRETADRLEARIAEVEREPEHSADRERRLALLNRQRSSLRDLAARRETAVMQLESAGLALQSLKLDLLKLRSSGVQAALGDVTNATQDARALSREIGHVLEAAEEVRRLS